MNSLKRVVDSELDVVETRSPERLVAELGVWVDGQRGDSEEVTGLAG